MSKAAAAAKDPKQELPKAEATLFRQIFTLIDEKQYKKALKNADTVLKKFPEHGETLAMKGLVLSNMGRREEGFDCVRAGIKANLRSHVCWHVYGLLYRAEHNLAEAVKCYRNAIRWDPENQQILRDLAQLQIHLRDAAGHAETRRVMLTSKSNVPANWMGFATAHAVAGNYKMADAILAQYEATLMSDPAAAPPRFESSEVALFRAQCLIAEGDREGALKIIGTEGDTYAAAAADSRAPVDALGALEMRLDMQLAAEQWDAALNTAGMLLKENVEHYGYHAALQCALLRERAVHAAAGASILRTVPSALASAQLARDDSRRAVLARVYIGMAMQYARAAAPRRILLDLLDAKGALFSAILLPYIRTKLRRGVPSLFSELKQLYRSASDAESTQTWPQRQQGRRMRGLTAGGTPTDRAAAIHAWLTAALPVKAMDTGAAGAELVLGWASATDPALLSGVATEIDALVASSKEHAHLPFGSSLDAAEVVRALCVDENAPEDVRSPELPSVFPWAALFAARHYDELGVTQTALDFVDAGLKHSPTVIDLHLAKARILKHAGGVEAAAAAAEYARTLDLADRYLNSKAVKYGLRAGHVDKSNQTLALFARHDSRDPSGDPLAHVKNMQVLWYETEIARAYERQGNLGLALKHYTRMQKHFSDMWEDQFDFHSYCLRKSTLRAYADMLATSDKLRSHPRALLAAAGAIRCYAALTLDVSARNGVDREFAAEEALSGATHDDSKPTLAAVRRQARQRAIDEAVAARDTAAKLAAAAAAKPKPPPDADSDAPSVLDTDPTGNTLVASTVDSNERAAHHAQLIDIGLPLPRAARLVERTTVSGIPARTRAVDPLVPRIRPALCEAATPFGGWTIPAGRGAQHAVSACSAHLLRGKILAAAAELQSAASLMHAHSSAEDRTWVMCAAQWLNGAAAKESEPAVAGKASEIANAAEASAGVRFDAARAAVAARKPCAGLDVPVFALHAALGPMAIVNSAGWLLSAAPSVTAADADLLRDCAATLLSTMSSMHVATDAARALGTLNIAAHVGAASVADVDAAIASAQAAWAHLEPAAAML